MKHDAATCKLFLFSIGKFPLKSVASVENGMLCHRFDS